MHRCCLPLAGEAANQTRKYNSVDELDAISGYIASLRKHKDPIPSDGTLVASLDLEYWRQEKRDQKTDVRRNGEFFLC